MVHIQHPMAGEGLGVSVDYWLRMKPASSSVSQTYSFFISEASA
jgi:hypothetical protein